MLRLLRGAIEVAAFGPFIIFDFSPRLHIASSCMPVWWISRDLLGTGKPLADGQCADLIVGDHTAGVSDDVRITVARPRIG